MGLCRSRKETDAIARGAGGVRDLATRQAPRTTTATLVTAMTALVRPGDEDAENGRKEEEPHHNQRPFFRPFPVIHLHSAIGTRTKREQGARPKALFDVFGPAIPP
jgi:hypothetical protein